MPVNTNQLTLIHTGPKGRQTYRYATDDTVAGVKAANYFNELVSHRIGKGDVIIASCDLDGTPEVATLIVSDVSTAGVVTVV